MKSAGLVNIRAQVYFLCAFEEKRGRFVSTLK